MPTAHLASRTGSIKDKFEYVRVGNEGVGSLYIEVQSEGWDQDPVQKGRETGLFTKGVLAQTVRHS